MLQKKSRSANISTIQYTPKGMLYFFVSFAPSTPMAALVIAD